MENSSATPLDLLVSDLLKYHLKNHNNFLRYQCAKHDLGNTAQMFLEAISMKHDLKNSIISLYDKLIYIYERRTNQTFTEFFENLFKSFDESEASYVIQCKIIRTLMTFKTIPEGCRKIISQLYKRKEDAFDTLESLVWEKNKENLFFCFKFYLRKIIVLFNYLIVSLQVVLSLYTIAITEIGNKYNNDEFGLFCEILKYDKEINVLKLKKTAKTDEGHEVPYYMQHHFDKEISKKKEQAKEMLSHFFSNILNFCTTPWMKSNINSYLSENSQSDMLTSKIKADTEKINKIMSLKLVPNEDS